MNERDFWLVVRQGLLLIVDAIERRLGIELKTADLRREGKEAGRLSTDSGNGLNGGGIRD